MDILIINLILIFIYGIFLLPFKNKTLDKLFILLVTTQLIFFNGFRHSSVGNDTPRYVQKFYNVILSTSYSDLKLLGDEIGYSVTQKLFSLFSTNFNLWLLAVSVFLYLLLGIFLYKHSERIFISYLLFIGLGFYEFSFSGIRQIISIILILITFKYIVNKQLIRFLVFILLAISFHYSAIVFLPMYFLAHIRVRSYHLIILVSTYILMYSFRNPIGKFLSVLYKDERVLDRYEISNSIGGLAIFILIIIIVGYIVYNPIKYADKKNTVLSNIMIISFFIQSLSSFSYLFTRLNMFYLIFIILYIPMIIDNFNKVPLKNNRIVALIFKTSILVVITYHYINKVGDDGAGIRPYLFFWE